MKRTSTSSVAAPLARSKRPSGTTGSRTASTSVSTTKVGSSTAKAAASSSRLASGSTASSRARAQAAKEKRQKSDKVLPKSAKSTTSNTRSKKQENHSNPSSSNKIESDSNAKTGKVKENVPGHHTSVFTDRKVAHRNAALNAMGGVRIDVYVRCRPPVDREGHEAVVVAIEDRDKTCVLTKDPDSEHKVEHRYSFDKVFSPETTQQQVYDDAIEPIVDEVVGGQSCCIFAYGQTGTGKTFTMRGDFSAPENAGLIQRSTCDLLNKLRAQQYDNVCTTASFLEIYNETLMDLLVEQSTTRKPLMKDKLSTTAKSAEKLVLVEDDERGCIVKNLTEVEFRTDGEIMSLLVTADRNARVAETRMNKLSNRAHRVFRINVTFTSGVDIKQTAVLTFVDLAGSEDISRSSTTGAMAAETKYINKSLLSLGRVIDALAANEKHIPYRDSKLTQLLADALGGMCKTTFVACISPCESSGRETDKTLRYAVRAMEALNISQLPQWKQDQIVIAGLTKRVEELLGNLDEQARNHKQDTMSLRQENRRLLKTHEILSDQLTALPGFLQSLVTTQVLNSRVRQDALWTSAVTVLKSAEEAAGDEQREITGHIAHLAEHNAAKLKLDQSDASASRQAVAELQEDIAHINHDTCAGLTAIDDTQATATAIVDRLSGTLGDQTKAFVKNTSADLRQRTQETERRLSATNETIGRLTGDVINKATTQLGVRAHAIDALCEQQSTQHTGVLAIAAAATAGADNALNATTHFVCDEFTRDTSMPLQHRDIQYPKEFAATASYDTILTSFKDDPWSTEVLINRGDLVAGEGTDYRGLLGERDASGIITETADVDLDIAAGLVIGAAQADSDTDAYDSEGEPPESTWSDDSDDDAREEVNTTQSKGRGRLSKTDSVMSHREVIAGLREQIRLMGSPTKPRRKNSTT
eukprot:m.215126 g.215126  ORF g.215126 m.215126 type:complete len:928 (+) comp19083_c0_seq11:169-2952(+)